MACVAGSGEACHAGLSVRPPGSRMRAWLLRFRIATINVLPEMEIAVIFGFSTNGYNTPVEDIAAALSWINAQ